MKLFHTSAALFIATLASFVAFASDAHAQCTQGTYRITRAEWQAYDSDSVTAGQQMPTLADYTTMIVNNAFTAGDTFTIDATNFSTAELNTVFSTYTNTFLGGLSGVLGTYSITNAWTAQLMDDYLSMTCSSATVTVNASGMTSVDKLAKVDAYLSIIDTLTNLPATAILTVAATEITGTVNGSGTIVISPATLSSSVNLANKINTTGSGVTLTFPATYTVNSPATLTLTAAQATGNTMNGTGTVAITNTTLSAGTYDFDGITPTTTTLSATAGTGVTLLLAPAHSSSMTINPDGANYASVTFTGTANADTVVVGNVDAIRTITGLAAADTLNGGGQADSITGGLGNDTINGNAGRDTAVFAGALTSATLANTTAFTVADATDGTDTLTGIENLQFSDGVIRVINIRSSEYTSLAGYIADNPSSTDKLFGALQLTSTTFSSGSDALASLNALIARFVSGSTVTVDVLGMNSNQLTALVAAENSLPPITYPPVRVATGSIIQGYYSDIPSAVSGASSGDTLAISAGTYTLASQLSVQKNLTFVGAATASTIIKAGFDTGSSGDPRGLILVGATYTANFSNLTVDGNGAGGSDVWQGVRTFGSGTFTNVAFSDIRFEYGGAGLYYQGTAVAAIGSGDVDFVGCSFTNIGRLGVIYAGAGRTGSITNSTFTGQGLGDRYNSAVEVADAAVVTVDNSVVSNYRGTAVTGTPGDPSFAFYVRSGGSLTLSNNSITNNLYAFEVASDATGVATCNWWGTTDASTIAGLVTNAGQFSPYLTSGTDSDGTTAGFQPASGTCGGEGAVAVVGSGRSYSTIQAALDASITTGSSTVSVSAGNYNESPVIKDSGLTVSVASGAYSGASGTTPLTFTLDGSLSAATLAGAGDANATGNASANTITGSGAVNVLSGSAAADTLSGGAGDDTVNGGDDADVLHGDAGSDVLHGDRGNDSLAGGDDNDTLNGGDDADTLTGGAGADTLNGDAGNDSMNGGAGDDTINGGASASDVDTAVFSGNLGTISGSTSLTVTSSSSANDGSDTVSNVEILDFADQDVVVVGRAGSSLADLNAALAAYPASNGPKFWGTLTINSSTSFSTAQQFSDIYGRLVSGGSTIAVNMTGMSADQISAVNANYGAASASLTNAPILIKRGTPLATVGQAPTIQSAIDYATAGDTVQVPAGAYYERLSISKALTLSGAQADQAVSGRAAAFTAGRASSASESILYPPSINTSAASGNMVRILANDVTVNGFTIDGSSPSLGTSGASLGGLDLHARDGVANQIDGSTAAITQNVIVRYNIIQNFARRGMTINGQSNGWADRLSGSDIRYNLVRGFVDRGISIAWNAFVDVRDNTISVDGANALGIGLFSFGGYTGGSCQISNNTVTVNAANGIGIIGNLLEGPDSAFTLSGNTVNAGSAITTADNAVAFIWRENSTGVSNFTNNVVGASGGNFAVGFHFWAIAAGATPSVSGGTVSRCDVGVQLAAVDFTWGAANGSVGSLNTVSLSGMQITADSAGVVVNASPLSVDPGNYGNTVVCPLRVNVSGLVCSSVDHFRVVGNNPGLHKASISFGAGNTATGGTNGVVVSGPQAEVVSGSLSNLALSGQSGDYIKLVSNSGNIDATSASFGGKTGAAATDAENFAVASKVTDKLDTTSLGRVTVKANTLFVNSGASVANGLSVASSGETVKFAGAAFTGGPFTVNTASLTLDAATGASGLSFTLGSADAVSLAGAGVIDVTGNANANTVTGNDAVNTLAGADGADTLSGGAGADVINGGDGNDSLTGGADADSLDGGSGTDTAVFAATLSTITEIASSNNISAGGDTITGVEILDFTDADVVVVGRGGSSISTLNAALAAYPAPSTVMFWGALEINASTFTTAEELAAIVARLVQGNSSITVNATGMSVDQRAAVAANASAINSASSLALTSADSAANIAILLGESTAANATVDMAGMNAAQIASVNGGIAKVASVSNYKVRIYQGSSAVQYDLFLDDRTVSTVSYPGAVARANTLKSATPASSFRVEAEAGTFALENVLTLGSVTLQGAGRSTPGGSVWLTKITPPAGLTGSPLVNMVTVTGNDATIRGLHLEGYLAGGISVSRGITVDSGASAVDGLTVDNVLCSIQQYGFGILDGESATDVTVMDSKFGACGNGIQVESSGALNGLTMSGSLITDNLYGFSSNADHNVATAGQPAVVNANTVGLTNVSVTNCQFNANQQKGLYFEKLNNASFTDITVDGNAVPGMPANNFGAGFELNLKYGAYSGITITNATVSGNGTLSGSNGIGLAIKARDDAGGPTGARYNDKPSSLSTVAINGGTVSGSARNLVVANNVAMNTVSFGAVSGSSLAVSGSGIGVQIFGTVPSGPLNLGAVSVASGASLYVQNGSTCAVTATGASFGGVNGASASLSDLYAVETKVFHAVDVAGAGVVTVKSGNIYVSSTNTVALGVGAASAGNTVNIEAGNYADGAVTVNTDNLTINGAAPVSGAHGYSFTLGTANTMTLAGTALIDVDGNGSANTVTGSDVANTLAGLAGADTLSGMGGADTLNGGDGDDSLNGGAGADSLNGGNDNDTITGGADADTIDGGDGTDTAVFAEAMGVISGSTTPVSAGGDSLTGVEILDFTDFDVVVVGRGGSSFSTLDAALASSASAGKKFWGNLVITKDSFTDAASLGTLLGRFVTGNSSVTVNGAGMSQPQRAAVADYAGDIASASALALDSTDSAEDIGILLGESNANATVNMASMAPDQIAAVNGGLSGASSVTNYAVRVIQGASTVLEYDLYLDTRTGYEAYPGAAQRANAMKAANGGNSYTVSMEAGTFNLNNKIAASGITLKGAGMDSSVIDMSLAPMNAASGVREQGILVTGAGTTLQDFTLQSPNRAANNSTGAAHGIKTNPNGDNTPDVNGLVVTNVKVRQVKRSALDLNGATNVTLNNFVAESVSDGYGLAISGVTNGVTVNSIATTNTVWGDVGVFPYPTSSSTLSPDNIVFADGGTHAINAITVQPYTSTISISVSGSSNQFHNGDANVIVPPSFNRVVRTTRVSDSLLFNLVTRQATVPALTAAFVAPAFSGTTTLNILGDFEAVSSGNVALSGRSTLDAAILAAVDTNSVNVWPGSAVSLGAVITKDITITGTVALTNGSFASDAILDSLVAKVASSATFSVALTDMNDGQINRVQFNKLAFDTISDQLWAVNNAGASAIVSALDLGGVDLTAYNALPEATGFLYQTAAKSDMTSNTRAFADVSAAGTQWAKYVDFRTKAYALLSGGSVSPIVAGDFTGSGRFVAVKDARAALDGRTLSGETVTSAALAATITNFNGYAASGQAYLLASMNGARTSVTAVNAAASGDNLDKARAADTIAAGITSSTSAADIANALYYQSAVAAYVTGGLTEGLITSVNAGTGANAMSMDQLNALAASAANLSDDSVIGDININSSMSSDNLAAFLPKVSASANVTIDATGMSGAYLTALVANDSKVDSILNLTLTSAVSAADISTLLNKATNAIVVATGMAHSGSAGDQLNAVAGKLAKVAADGIRGTVNLSNSTDNLDSFLAKCSQLASPNGSLVTVNASGMSDAKLTVLSGRIGNIDSITSLTITSAQPAAEIAILLTKSVDAIAVVTDMAYSGTAGDQINAVAAGTAGIAADGIRGSVTVSSSLTSANLGAFLGKCSTLASPADSTVAVDADTFSTASKAVVSANIARVDSISNLDLDSSDVDIAGTPTNTVIANLLTKATGATAVATSMSTSQLNALGAGSSAIANDGISGTFTLTNAINYVGAILGKTQVDATVTVDALGMNQAKLDEVAANLSKVDYLINVQVTVSAALSLQELIDLLDASSDGTVLVDATNMDADYLNAVAARAIKVAANGITGTMIVTSAIVDANLDALLAKASTGATVEINASSMSSTELTAVAANITRVDEIYNLTLTSAQVTSPVDQITALLSKSVASASTGKDMAVATATGMSGAQINALAGSAAKLANNGITGTLVLVNAVTDANMVILLGGSPAKVAAAADVEFDGTSMSSTQLAHAVTYASLVDTTYNLSLTSTQTAAQIDSLLSRGISAAATGKALALADATSMSSAAGNQLAKLADNYLKIQLTPTKGITGAIAIDSGLTSTQITNLVSRIFTGSSFTGGTSVVINASGMSDAQLSSVASSVTTLGNSVLDITDITLTANQSSAELALLISATNSGEATVVATGMDSNDLNALGTNGAALGTVTGTVVIDSNVSAAAITALMNTSVSSGATVTIDPTGFNTQQQNAYSAALTTQALFLVSAQTVGTATETFVKAGETVRILVSAKNLPLTGPSAVAAQGRINYDSSRLTFVTVAGGSAMPTLLTGGAGSSGSQNYVTFYTGISIAQGSQGIYDGVVAEITFTATTDGFCKASDLASLNVSFANQLVAGSQAVIPAIGTTGMEVSALKNLALSNVPAGTADATDGVANLSYYADAFSTTGAIVTNPGVTAANNCGAESVVISITYPNSSTGSVWPAEFPIGTSRVVWSSTDSAGNTTSASRDIVVINKHLMTVDVDLAPTITAPGPFTLPIRFRLSSGVAVTADVSFTAGGNGTVRDVEIPVLANYTCITAKDSINTLADAQTMSVSGTKWVCSGTFSLPAGDATDDNVKDIFDFAAFVTDRGVGKNELSRSNFNRDGQVNNGDFSFISLNFLAVGDNCNGGFFNGGARDRVSVKELRRMGLGYMEEADIDGDGWVDTNDIALAAQGQYRRQIDGLDQPGELEQPNW